LPKKVKKTQQQISSPYLFTKIIEELDRNESFQSTTIGF